MPKIAFAHDWLNGMRGGEKCLLSMLRVYPHSNIYTLLYQRGKLDPLIESQSIHTSFLQKLPGVMKAYKWYLPLFPIAIRSLKVQSADVIVSNSHCVAKGIKRSNSETPHVCYCFTPMRYAWLFFDEYFGHYPKIMQLLIRLILNRLKEWDKNISKEVTHFVAISEHVRERIKRFYQRPADVIYPPVDVQFYQPGISPREDYYLVVSAWVPYKRVDLAIAACEKLGRKLIVIGSGPEEQNLKRMAQKNTQILGFSSAETLREHYQKCRGLIFPGEEDFGIVPVEAQACGSGVIAYNKGGALETILPNKTGVFFDHQTLESLIDAIQRYEYQEWNPQVIRAHAEKFSEQRFLTQFENYIQNVLNQSNPQKISDKAFSKLSQRTPQV